MAGVLLRIGPGGRRSCGSARGHRGLRRRDVHPHYLPDVAVRILEAAAVHEDVILLRDRVDPAACAAGTVNHRVDVFAAVGGDGDKHLAGRLRTGGRRGGDKSGKKGRYRWSAYD